MFYTFDLLSTQHLIPLVLFVRSVPGWHFSEFKAADII